MLLALPRILVMEELGVKEEGLGSGAKGRGYFGWSAERRTSS